MDSQERASDALPALEGAAQEAPKEACAYLEDRIPTGGPPNVNRVVGEAPLEIVVELLFSTRLANADPLRLRGIDKLVISTPIIPMKWVQPSTSASVPGPNRAQSIIDRWSPFNQRDTYVTHMLDLYPSSHPI